MIIKKKKYKIYHDTCAYICIHEIESPNTDYCCAACATQCGVVVSASDAAEEDMLRELRELELLEGIFETTNSDTSEVEEGLNKFHYHKLERITQGSRSWVCDGKHFERGCNKRGSGSVPRFRCTEGCDFDLCEECTEVENYCVIYMSL
jgi:hypothetical protein